MSHTDVLFRDLHADDLPEVTEIESLCLNCHEDGITKLLLTKIPFFREVIISSFSCEHCGFHNTSLDSAGRTQDKGVKFTLKVVKAEDMNRRIVLNKNSVLSIPELDSEFPIKEGAFTTIEGVLDLVIENISGLQDTRRAVSPDLAIQLDQFIEKMKSLKEFNKEFTIELTDTSGNSIIENLIAPKPDPQLTVKYFKRSAEENEALGISEEANADMIDKKTYVEQAQDDFKPANEILFINDFCADCNAPIECRIKQLDIPHFKEVIVSASSCDNCGKRENEIISGCGIADKGQRITLQINETVDLSRDFLMSEKAGIRIPQLDVETSAGSLGGRFSTVEGILNKFADNLGDSNAFLSGDSATRTVSEIILRDLIDNVRKIASGEMLGVSIVVCDPSSNSYIQDLYAPEVDPRLVVESYDRTDEENEELGLNDMKTAEFES